MLKIMDREPNLAIRLYWSEIYATLSACIKKAGLINLPAFNFTPIGREIYQS